MVKSQELVKIMSKIPQNPGIYKFIGKKNNILYIGKATSLKNRVRSYFTKDIGQKRSPLIEKMVDEVKNIKFIKTNSVLEAFILEVNEIKKWQPPYNTAEKDQRSFNYVVITEEKFPRVIIMRERELQTNQKLIGQLNIKHKFGPFTNNKQLKEALKIVRKIFPFRDKCSVQELGGNKKPCFNYQIGLCPGVCIGKISEKEYKKTIKNIATFFEGKTKKLDRDLDKEMKVFVKKMDFENAEKIKRKIFALKHIQDIALIKDTPRTEKQIFRIEGYDVAHISGKSVVGVMTVLENGELNKKEYRMFKISDKNSKGDTNSLREILERRLKHTEWKMPNLIVVDGGDAQLNTVKNIIKNMSLKILVSAVTKDEHHKAKEIRGLDNEKEIISKYKKEILLINSESHRFALNFHRKLRAKSFI